MLGATVWGTAATAPAAPLPDAAFQATPLVTGLREPVAARDFGGPLFVAEAHGEIKVWAGDLDGAGETVVDLSRDVHRRQDRGMLGFDVHPDYPRVPWMWVLFSRDALPGGDTPHYGRGGPGTDPCPNDQTDGCPASVELRRLVLDPATHRVVAQHTLLKDLWCEQFPMHSADAVRYGPDGALYITAGDGAHHAFNDYGQLGASQAGSTVPTNPCGDPPVPPGGRMDPTTAEGGALRAQDLLTPGDPLGAGGSALRVDPETGAALPDNPLYGGDPADDRHIAIGLRNPFRVTFDDAGNVWYGDVGWGQWEEVDIQSPHELVNFGWPCYEGVGRTEAGPGGFAGYATLGNVVCESLYRQKGAVRPPAFAYGHTGRLGGCDNGSVISALAIYDGRRFPTAYHGALFFADAGAGCVYAVAQDDQGRIDPSTLTRVLAMPGIVDISPGPNGTLLLVDLGGQVLRLDAGQQRFECAHSDEGAEPNQTFAQAAPIAVGRHPFLLCPATDRDWLSVHARRGEKLYVRVEHGSGDGADWAVHGPNRVVYEAGIAAAQGTSNEQIGDGDAVIRVPADGPYRIRVSTRGPDTVVYDLRVATCVDDAHGNDAPQATPQQPTGPPPPVVLRNGVAVDGVRCSWQYDRYAVDARAGDRVEVALRREVGADTPRPGGELTGAGTSLRPEATTTTETDVRETYRIPADGRYAFSVTGPRGGIANGRYTVTARGSTAPSARPPIPFIRVCGLVRDDVRVIDLPPSVREALGLGPPRQGVRVC